MVFRGIFKEPVIGDIGAVQAANAVKLGKGAVIIIRGIGKKFALRLFAQRFGVHKEQDALHFTKLQQTVCRRDRSKGLACARSHLHQRLGTVVREGSVQILDRCDLAFAESGSVKGREVFHVVADRVVF